MCAWASKCGRAVIENQGIFIMWPNCHKLIIPMYYNLILIYDVRIIVFKLHILNFINTTFHSVYIEFQNKRMFVAIWV